MPPSTSEPRYGSAWQVMFFLENNKKTHIKQIRQSKSVIECWEAGSWHWVKYTRVLFTACLLWTAPLTTLKSIHTMDTTLNTSRGRQPLQQFGHSSFTSPPKLVLLKIQWSIAEFHLPYQNLSSKLHLCNLLWTCEYTNSVSTTLSLQKGW